MHHTPRSPFIHLFARSFIQSSIHSLVLPQADTALCAAPSPNASLLSLTAQELRQQQGQQPVSQPLMVQANEVELLQQRVHDLETAQGDTRVEQLQQRVRELEGLLEGTPRNYMRQLQQRVAELEAALDEAQVCVW